MADRAEAPVVVVIGGPNGAGKTTTAGLLLPEALGIRHFVNADTLAAGLSAFAPESAAFEAGRMMLRRLEALARRRESFAFETTLASRSFAPFLQRLRSDGYAVRIAYLGLQSPELAVHRVAERVRRGGHSIPADTIRRRYGRSGENLRKLYLPLADSAVIADNSDCRARILAAGSGAALRSLPAELNAPPAELAADSFFTSHALESIRRATEQAVAEHRLFGHPVYVWREGEIARLNPDSSVERVGSQGVTQETANAAQRK